MNLLLPFLCPFACLMSCSGVLGDFLDRVLSWMSVLERAASLIIMSSLNGKRLETCIQKLQLTFTCY